MFRESENEIQLKMDMEYISMSLSLKNKGNTFYNMHISLLDIYGLKYDFDIFIEAW